MLFMGGEKHQQKPNDLKIMKKINVSRLAFSFNTYSLCVYVCMQLGMDSTYIWIYEQSIFLVKIHQCFYTWKNHIQMTIPLLLKTKPKESMKKKRKPKPSPSQKKKNPTPTTKQVTDKEDIQMEKGLLQWKWSDEKYCDSLTHTEYTYIMWYCSHILY